MKGLKKKQSAHDDYVKWLSRLRKNGCEIKDLLNEMRTSEEEKWKNTISKNIFNLFSTALDQDGLALEYVIDSIGKDFEKDRFNKKQLKRLMEIAIKTTPEALQFLPEGFEDLEEEALRVNPNLFYMARKPGVEDICLSFEHCENITFRMSMKDSFRLVFKSSVFLKLPLKIKMKLLLKMLGFNNLVEFFILTAWFIFLTVAIISV